MERCTLRLLLTAGAFLLVTLCAAAQNQSKPSRGLLLVGE